MHDHDRDAILARRALFISAALAGFGCTTHEPPADPEPQVEQQPLTPELEGAPLAGPSDGERPSWSQIMAAAPPLDVPPKLTKSEHELLQNLASNMQARYAQLEKVWTQLPTCAPSQADCKAWAQAVETVLDTQEDWGALCGYSPEVTHAFLEREREHRRYLYEIGQLLLADLDAAAQALDDAAELAAWQRQREHMTQPRPQPCLSCMAPTNEPVLVAVSFDAGQRTPAAAQDDNLASVVSIQQRNRKAKLLVRGHADASEPDPDALARARAEAVASALLGLGLKKGDIEVRSYGATLPISREQVELNCRVDFEVVEH